MKLKGLILVCLMIVSGSANATVVTTSAVAGAGASANISHQIRQEHTINAINSVNNALDNSTKVIVPCKPQYLGVFDSRVDRELTIEECEEAKKKFERLNDVKYKFGKAVSWDRYNGYFYFELIEE